MAINIEMPKLSDTMTAGTLVAWKVKVGDEVEIGDVLAEIETDKATMEMEAFDEGTVSQILIQEGEQAPVGAVLGVLAEEGDEKGASPAESASTAAPTTISEPSTQTAAAANPATQAATPTLATEDGKRLKVSPLARKLAAAKGVNVATVQGSGPGGRIVAADIEKAAAAPQTTAPAATPASAPAPVGIMPTYGEEDKIVPLSGMRKIIAERLLTSKQTIPHFYLHVEADTASLMELRKQVNSQAEQTHGNKYSVNDFVVKALINACVKVPAVNAAFNGDSIVEYKNVGISVAIAVEDGLVTPVVKEAQTKSLLEISKEIKAMAKRARDKKLLPNEFDGGTVTISNLGAWGVESFDAIVNPPQAAILSVGGITKKPVLDKNGQIVAGQRMNIGISCDHRVVDGAVAADFLNEVKRLIENPTLMLI